MSFFWYSLTGDKEAWKLATSAARAQVIADVAPQFVTVLDASHEPQEGWGRDDFLKLKYSGPLYFDWDSEDLERSIRGFQAMLDKLEDEHDFDLSHARLFATGGRGFHLEIPPEVFLQKATASGLAHLPHIYREMALELHTDALDMRIYSARRGRMWRVPGVQRSNGFYKVPISPLEAREMTPDSYKELCSKPRRYYCAQPDKTPHVPAWLVSPQGELACPNPPQPNISLQALFAAKRQAVEAVVRRQGKARDDSAALDSFSGVLPVSVREIFNGQHLNDKAGFNDIALQFAILAVALKMNEDSFIEACRGLIDTHKGDSARYASPGRRADALRERFNYVQCSDVYRFSLKALRSVLDPKFAPAELFGALIAETRRYAPELPPEQLATRSATVCEPTDPEAAQALRAAAENELGGLNLKETGFYLRDAEGNENRLSDLAIFNPEVLREASTGALLAIKAHVGVVKSLDGSGIALKEAVFKASDFQSRVSLDAALQQHLSYYKGSDVGATMLRKILVDSALKNERVQYTLSREGIDIIEQPDLLGPQRAETLAWVSSERVLLPEDLRGEESDKPRFVYRPRLGTNANLKLDAHLFDIPQAGDDGFRAYMENLVKINAPDTVGKMLGWFVSCFHRRLHHATHNEFPLMWVYGPAGSGKSTTPTLLYRLFTSRPPGSWVSLQRGVTNFAWQVLMSQTTTAPVVVDEFKEVDFVPQRFAEIMSDFRAAYNSGCMMRAGVRTGQAGASYQDTHQFERCAPIAVLSETYTDETATRERCVPVDVSPADANVQAWNWVNDEGRVDYLTQLGSLLLRRTLLIDPREFAQKWKETRKHVEDRLPGLTPRPINNYAVVLMGLDFLKESLLEGVSLDFEKEIFDLKHAVMAAAERHMRFAPTRSEAIKTLQDMAYLSHEIDSGDPQSLRENFEYMFFDDGTMHMDMYRAAMRYLTAARQRGMQVYYRNAEVLIAGLSRIPAVTSDACTHSPLYAHRGSRVFSFDLRILAENGVQPFKGQPTV